MESIKITTDEHGFPHVYTPGGEEITSVAGLIVRWEPRNGFKPVAELKIYHPIIEAQATVEVKTTIEYINLGRHSV